MRFKYCPVCDTELKQLDQIIISPASVCGCGCFSYIYQAALHYTRFDLTKDLDGNKFDIVIRDSDYYGKSDKYLSSLHEIAINVNYWRANNRYLMMALTG